MTCPNAIRSEAARSRACAPLTKKRNEIQVFFVHALFLLKTLKSYGFSGNINGTLKNPIFFLGGGGRFMKVGQSPAKVFTYHEKDFFF